MNFNFNQLLSREKSEKKPSRPILFDPAREEDQISMERLFADGGVFSIVDEFKEQLQELFQVENPSLVYAPNFEEKFQEYLAAKEKERPLAEHGVWAYFPWSGALIHILPERDFYKVRTARNKNLITEEEQDKFYNATFGFAGLSVGANILIAIVLSGGAKKIKIADFDTLSLSNTNRIVTSVENLGLKKAEMVSRIAYSINPYTEIEWLSDGLHEKNIEKFFDGLDIMVEEIDAFHIKYLAREECRKRKIPLIMATDNGDNGMVDIERYDLDQTIPAFHGRIGEANYGKLKGLHKFEIGKLITQYVGAENVTERMRASLLEIGKTLVSWPQLGNAALLNAAAMSYAARKILNGEKVDDNRVVLSLDASFVPGHMGKEEVKRRNEAAQIFKKEYGI